MYTLVFAYIIISLVVSFICSLCESILLSVSPSYLALEEKSGSRTGVILTQLKNRMDRPLAAILTLNTMATMLGAAGVGAEAHRQYGDDSVTFFSFGLTFLVLIGGEIVPKSIGAANWKVLAPFAARAVLVMIYMTYPVVLISEFLSKRVNHESEQPNTITREEMIASAEVSADEGEIRHKESAIIKNLLMLDTIRVGEIMTPRSVMMAFDEDLTVEEIVNRYKPLRFSRIPTYNVDLDHVTGLIHRYKILEAASNDQEKVKLKDLAIPIHAIPENVTVSAAIDQFLKRKEHLFLVRDDYGSTEGIVTLEDAIETLLGVEIVDEFDTVVDMRELALQKWRERKLAGKLAQE